MCVDFFFFNDTATTEIYTSTLAGFDSARLYVAMVAAALVVYALWLVLLFGGLGLVLRSFKAMPREEQAAEKPSAADKVP